MYHFIHAADIHLDSPLAGLSAYEGAPVERIRNASRRAFEALIDFTLETEAEFLLLAGDLYDGAWKDFQTGLFFLRQMARLDREGVQVFIVAGNHDAESKTTKTLELPSNVHMFSSKRPESVRLESCPVAVHGQTYKKQICDENLAAGYPGALQDCLNIGLLHTSLDGRPGHANYAPCSMGDLESKGYDYWALGHVHAHELVSHEPWVVFPGCLQGRHIRETGPKGCVLVSFDEEGIQEVTQQVMDLVRWEEIALDLTGIERAKDVGEKLRDVLQQRVDAVEDRLLAVRIVLEGATPFNSVIRADRNKWEHQVRAIATQVDEESLWVEKVKFKIRGKRDLSEVLAADSPLSDLIRRINEIPEEVEAGSRFKEDLEELEKKLGSKVLRQLSDSFPESDFTRSEVQTGLVQQAKGMLVAQLLVEEVEK